MDLLERLLRHDAWTTRRLLVLSQGLSRADAQRPFDLGLRSVEATLAHIVRNMEVWTALMDGQADPVRLRGSDEATALIVRHEIAVQRLSALAREIAERNAWDETWTDTLEDPPRARSFGGTIGHLLTHSCHHRAQVIHMLKAVGVRDVPEGDLLSWEAAGRPKTSPLYEA